MNIVDAVMILMILLGGVIGLKRGAIRTFVELVGTIALLVISYTLKDYVADILIEYLPFFNYFGIFKGITAINVLMYEVIAFIVIFVIFYCILNILLSLSGVIDRVLKFTLIYNLPSRIIGLVLGLVDGVIIAYLIAFCLLHLPQTEGYVLDSKLAVVTLQRTPIIGAVALRTTLVIEDIYDIIKDIDHNDEQEVRQANLQVIHQLLYYEILTKGEAQKLVDDKKVNLGEQVTF